MTESYVIPGCPLRNIPTNTDRILERIVDDADVFNLGRIDERLNLYAALFGAYDHADRNTRWEYAAVAGSDKVLFGSDYGLSDGMILEDRLDAVRFAGLTSDQTAAILHGNAARLLNLEDSL